MSMYAYWLANTGLTVPKLTGLMTEGIGAEELYALQEAQMKKIPTKAGICHTHSRIIKRIRIMPLDVVNVRPNIQRRVVNMLGFTQYYFFR